MHPVFSACNFGPTKIDHTGSSRLVCLAATPNTHLEAQKSSPTWKPKIVLPRKTPLNCEWTSKDQSLSCRMFFGEWKKSENMECLLVSTEKHATWCGITAIFLFPSWKFSVSGFLLFKAPKFFPWWITWFHTTRFGPGSVSEKPQREAVSPEFIFRRLKTLWV